MTSYTSGAMYMTSYTSGAMYMTSYTSGAMYDRVKLQPWVWAERQGELCQYVHVLLHSWLQMSSAVSDLNEQCLSYLNEQCCKLPQWAVK